MCYGICSFEGHMGECDSILLSCKDEIKERTGFTPCFIGGGDRMCPEDWEYWDELSKQGKIKEYRHIANDIIRKEYKNIEKIWKSELTIKG